MSYFKSVWESIRRDPKSVKVFHNALRHHPAAMRSLAIWLKIDQIADSLRYPITSFDDLSRKVGPDPIEVADDVVYIEDLRPFVPAYYFPVTDKQNLMEKAGELYRSHNVSQRRLRASSYQKQNIQPRLVRAHDLFAKYRPKPGELKNMKPGGKITKLGGNK